MRLTPGPMIEPEGRVKADHEYRGHYIFQQQSVSEPDQRVEPVARRAATPAFRPHSLIDRIIDKSRQRGKVMGSGAAFDSSDLISAGGSFERRHQPSYSIDRGTDSCSDTVAIPARAQQK